jgi:hypothetical protein
MMGNAKDSWAAAAAGAAALLGIQKANADRSPTENVMWLDVVPLITRGGLFLADRGSGFGISSSVSCSKVVDTDISPLILSMRKRT